MKGRSSSLKGPKAWRRICTVPVHGSCISISGSKMSVLGTHEREGWRRAKNQFALREATLLRGCFGV